MVRFLLGWSAWDLTQSATWVGVVAGLMLLPAFLLSPIFGIVSDRINPRNGLLVTVSLHGVIACVAGAVTALQWYSLPWLLMLSLALGTVTSAHTPIRLALIPRLVTRQALPSAIGYSAIIFNISRILGPAAGAALLSQGSAALAFFATAPLFLVALPLLLSVHGLAMPGRREKASFPDELRAGLNYVGSHRGLRLIFGYTLINALLGRTVIELLPALSGQLLHGDSSTLATLTASAGAGSIIGGLIVSRQSSNENYLMNMVTLCLLIGAASLLTLWWLDGLPALCGLILLLSMITTMVGTASQALAQLMVAEDYRGRVLSLWTVIAMGAPSIGTVVMGSLADVLGFAPVLAGFAVLAIIGIAVLFRSRRQYC